MPFLRFNDAGGNGARVSISFSPARGTSLYTVREFSLKPGVLTDEHFPE